MSSNVSPHREHVTGLAPGERVAPSARGLSIGRVPVEHRVTGLDKRSFPYAFFVLAVFVVCTVVLPRIDDALEWDDPIRAGEQLALTESGVVFEPATGWNVEEGFRLDLDTTVPPAGRAVVVDDGVRLSVVPGEFDGTPAELLAQIEKVDSSTTDPTFRIDGDPTTFTTPHGDVGVIQTYTSENGDGVIAALVIDGTGVEVTATGPTDHMRSASGEIGDMIGSIRATDEGDAR